MIIGVPCPKCLKNNFILIPEMIAYSADLVTKCTPVFCNANDVFSDWKRGLSIHPQLLLGDTGERNRPFV